MFVSSQESFYSESHGVEELRHWRIQGALPACAPPTGSISFVFAYVFAEKCTHRRLAPPMGRHAPQREILDPPLLRVPVFLIQVYGCCTLLSIGENIKDYQMS